MYSEVGLVIYHKKIIPVHFHEPHASIYQQILLFPDHCLTLRRQMESCCADELVYSSPPRDVIECRSI